MTNYHISTHVCNNVFYLNIVHRVLEYNLKYNQLLNISLIGVVESTLAKCLVYRSEVGLLLFPIIGILYGRLRGGY